jgi:hypothetical protein
MFTRALAAIRHNLVAWLALFVALGGTSLAARHYVITSTKQIKPSVLTQLEGKTGKTGPAGPQGLAGPAGSQGPGGAQGVRGLEGVPGQSATALWGKLDEAGELVSGSHVVSTTGSAGIYFVTFDRDISKCAAVATPNGPPAQVVVTAAFTGGSAVEVLVAERATGTLAAARVSLAVFCP